MPTDPVRPSVAYSNLLTLSAAAGLANQLVPPIPPTLAAPPGLDGRVRPLDGLGCDPPPVGLVAWWQAEGNTSDALLLDNGAPFGSLGYLAGEVGEAFAFDGLASYVQVPYSSLLLLTNQLTIECWVKRRALTQEDYLLNRGGDYSWNALNYGVTLNSSLWGGKLVFTFSGGYRRSVSITDYNWHHIAVVATNAQTDVAFYVDGVPQPTTDRSGATVNLYPSTKPLYIGAQYDTNSGWYYYSSALVDEVSIYNRGLSATDIQAIYNAGAAGKCLVLPPVILTQPASQRVPVGDTAFFDVVAGGSDPLSYQWRFNGTDLPGATDPDLVLTGVQSANSGSYSVLLSNAWGQALSSNAVLDVYSPSCVSPPDGLAAWWAAEGNAYDSLCLDNGTPHGGVTFTNGQVGSAFCFDGATGYVQVPDSSTLHLTSQLTLECWVRRRSAINEDYLINKGGDYTRNALNFGLTLNSTYYGGKIAFTFAGGYRRSVALTDYNWHHIAVTARNGDPSPYFYVDGTNAPVTESGGAATLNLYPSTQPLYIGAQIDPNSGWYYYSSVVLDEVSLYTNILRPDQIQTNYLAGAGGKCNLPADWLEYYFGPNYQNHPYAGVTADADGDGVSNLQEFLHGTDPDKIQFFLSVTNQYVTNTAAPVQLNITAGVPAYIALLVNTTNATWQPFTTSSLSVPTPTNGVYVVTVGLCGWAPTATRTWQTITLFRDTSPLGLVLTNLPSLSGSRPFLDPAGYATRALSSITWTLIDASGNTNGGNGAVVAQGWSPSDPFHTTNQFQCLDLALALGTNHVSIQAVDWAGNAATTNFAYVFGTNGNPAPPSLTLLWPADGTHVTGDSFTVQAWTDDDSAAVALQYTDANSIVQTINGLVERGGNVWVPGVPLVAGTNRLSLLATNAAGKVSTNSFSVIQSGLALTVYPLLPDAMQYGYATNYVTVGNPASAVSVNGIPGTSYDGMNWTVGNVPLPPGEMVALQATAQLADGTTHQTLLTQERGPIVFTQTYHYNLDYSMVNWTPVETNSSTTVQTTFDWSRGVGGTNAETTTTVYFDPQYIETNVRRTVWPPDSGYVPTLQGQQVISDYYNGQLLTTSTSTVDPPAVEWVEDSSSSGAWPENFDVSWTESSSREVRLFTGGAANRQNQGLFDLSASLVFESCLNSVVPDWGFVYQTGGFLGPANPPVPVPSTQTILAGLGTLGADGHLWKLEPDGVEVAVTPKALSALSALPRAAFGALSSSSRSASTTGPDTGEQKYKLRISFRGQDVTDTNTTLVVGQNISLLCYLDPLGGPAITNYQWSIPGTYVGGYVTASVLGTNLPVNVTTDVVIYCWVDKLDAGDVTCEVKAPGEKWRAKTTFNVLKPTADWTGRSCGKFSLESGGIYFEDFTNGVDGMTFTFTNKNLMGYTNTYGFKSAQVGAMQVTFVGTNASGATKTVTLAAQGLDKTFPYKDFGAIVGGTAVDSPGGPIGPSATNSPLVYVSSATYSGQFDHYLFFQPGELSSIPVAVKRVSWQFSMQATNSGATTSADTLVLSNCTASVTGTNVPVTGNPQWTNNLIYQTKTVTP